MSHKIIRKTTKPSINEITGLSDGTLWRLEKEGRFPRRIRLGENGSPLDN
jgi:predicted DNA-binding transcriptional regulator AlpA